MSRSKNLARVLVAHVEPLIGRPSTVEPNMKSSAQTWLRVRPAVAWPGMVLDPTHQPAGHSALGLGEGGGYLAVGLAKVMADKGPFQLWFVLLSAAVIHATSGATSPIRLIQTVALVGFFSVPMHIGGLVSNAVLGGPRRITQTPDVRWCRSVIGNRRQC